MTRSASLDAQQVRRCSESQDLRSRRLSSSEVPPQIPDSWLVANANSRQDRTDSQLQHTCLADSICSIAAPVLPTGKNRSGSVSRHAARSRQSSTSHSMLRLQAKATRNYLSDKLVKRITYMRLRRLRTQRLDTLSGATGEFKAPTFPF